MVTDAACRLSSTNGVKSWAAVVSSGGICVDIAKAASVVVTQLVLSWSSPLRFLVLVAGVIMHQCFGCSSQACTLS